MLSLHLSSTFFPGVDRSSYLSTNEACAPASDSFAAYSFFRTLTESALIWRRRPYPPSSTGGSMLLSRPEKQRLNFFTSEEDKLARIFNRGLLFSFFFFNAVFIPAKLVMAAGPEVVWHWLFSALVLLPPPPPLTRSAPPQQASYRSKLKCNFLLLISRHYPARTKQNTLIQLSPGQRGRQLPPFKSPLLYAKQEMQFLIFIPIFFTRLSRNILTGSAHANQSGSRGQGLNHGML